MNEVNPEKDWLKVCGETILFPETNTTGETKWRLQTGDPQVARRVRRKAGFTEASLKWMWGPCRLWWFDAEFSSRRNAIRALSRNFKQKCFWDAEKKVVAVLKEVPLEAVTS